MTKSDLISAVAEKTGLTKKCSAAAIDAMLDTVVGAVKKGDKVQIVGFGAFEQRKRAARTGVNPQTKKKINIAASKVPAFRAGSAFKDALK